MIKLSISYDKTLENGAQKNVTEQYLTNEETHTEAEKRIADELAQFIGDYDVKSSVKTKYAEVILTDGDIFYNVKAEFITIDEKSGKEKASKFSYLVTASDFRAAIDTFEKFMKDSLMDYRLLSVQETGIVDYFQ